MKAVFLFLIFTVTKAMAQTDSSTVIGDWYLQGVMEVGSGFRFNKDNSFDFFLSYGALDRAAKGTWEQHGDSIVLNNAKKPPRDFNLVQSKNTNSNNITIKISAANHLLLRNVYAELQCADTTYRSQSNEAGVLVFPKCSAQQLSLVHEFWPERFSAFELSKNNYFEFTIAPWIGDVEFNHVVLIFKDGVLTGPHPLLEKKRYTYVR